MLVKVIHNNDVAKAVLKQYKAIAKADVKAPDYEHYAGVYNVVPDETLQTLDTSEKYVEQDISIQPIPDEYADVSDTTALAQDVLRNKYFYDRNAVRVMGELLDYVGDYTVTPANTATTLATENKRLTDNIVVNPIPSQYANVTDTTATSSDVLSGKKFHLANGLPAYGSIQTYSGSSTFTPSTSTQTVQTAAKYVEQDITINAIPSNYADVSGVTAQAADVELGKYFVTAAGLLTAGTLDKLEYESGVWVPASDTANGTIPFSNVHSTLPAIYMIQDDAATQAPNNSCIMLIYANYAQFSGVPTVIGSDNRYAIIFVEAVSGTGTSSANYTRCKHPASDSGDSDTSYPRYWCTESELKPYSYNASRHFYASRQYKWIAIWV